MAYCNFFDLFFQKFLSKFHKNLITTKLIYYRYFALATRAKEIELTEEKLLRNILDEFCLMEITPLITKSY